ncbi:MAG: protein kinase [Gemmatimonadales bacterium]
MTLDALTAALADRYRLEHELGAGGMATVHLAQDLKHDRQVAIKVLKPELAAVIGAERFLAEIKTTASLQHPHILPLFDSGTAANQLFYVMPYIEGETLRDRLTRETQLAVPEAIRLATEVAGALEYAHKRGIVHRDIKPENILLLDGSALVADFGIALAVQQAGGERMTQTGMSLGTPHYMSPEQAMGDRSVDARSDVYALGAITYEMLVGEPPFTGPNGQAILAKVMTEPARDVSAQRRSVSPAVSAAVAHALEKLPADRFASAAEFAAALGATGGGFVPSPAARRGPDWRIGVLGGVVLGAIGAGAAMVALGAGGGDRFATPGLATPVTWEQGLEITPALSPDGKQVAYAVTNGTASRIYLRATTDGRPTPLTADSTAVETNPRWSHDGTRVLYLSNGRVFSAPAGGGPGRQEVPSRGNPVSSATWSPDDSEIAYGVLDTLFIRGRDGTSRVLAIVDQSTLCTWGARDLIACSAGNPLYLAPGLGFGNIAPSWISVIRVADGHTTMVTDQTASNQSPAWSRDGRHLLYASNRLGPADIYAVGMRDDGTPDGAPERLTVGLNVSTFSLAGDDARLAYGTMTTSSNIWSEPWDDRGRRTAAPPTQVTFGQQTIEQFAFSRDGAWLYYDSDLAGNADLYRMSMASGVPERLTSDPTPEFAPAPSPDGREVAFHSFRGASRDIYVLPLDGGPLQQVTDTPEQEGVVSWSPDGTTLSFFQLVGQAAIGLARRRGAGSWELLPPVAPGWWASWSPDGQWLSYTTDLLGGELRVVPSAGGESRALWGGWAEAGLIAESSLWSDDGRTIYFKSHSADGAGSIWSIPTAGGTPRFVQGLGDARRRSDRYGFRVSGGRLYYTLVDRQGDVWMMELER